MIQAISGVITVIAGTLLYNNLILKCFAVAFIASSLGAVSASWRRDHVYRKQEEFMYKIGFWKRYPY